MMLVERHYTRVSRRVNAKCINCGFWFDLADVLRFFKRVLESGHAGGQRPVDFGLSQRRNLKLPAQFEEEA